MNKEIAKEAFYGNGSKEKGWEFLFEFSENRGYGHGYLQRFVKFHDDGKIYKLWDGGCSCGWAFEGNDPKPEDWDLVDIESYKNTFNKTINKDQNFTLTKAGALILGVKGPEEESISYDYKTFTAFSKDVRDVKGDKRVLVIPACGKGTRIAELTNGKHKMLLPYKDKTIIETILERYTSLVDGVIIGVSPIHYENTHKELIKMVIENKNIDGSKVDLFKLDSNSMIETMYKLSFLEKENQKLNNKKYDTKFLSIASDNIVENVDSKVFIDKMFGAVVKNLDSYWDESIDVATFLIESTHPQDFSVYNPKDGTFEDKPKVPKSNWITPAIYAYSEVIIELFNGKKLAKGKTEPTIVENVFQMVEEVGVVKFKDIKWNDLGLVQAYLDNKKGLK